MVLYSCCGLLTLQVGVAVLAITFWTYGFGILVVNFLAMADESGSTPTNYIYVGIFLILLLLSGVLMFLAAYRESQLLCIFSIFLIAIMVLMFGIGSGISFFNKPKLTRNVCIFDRCPESFWLASLRYRKNTTGISDDYYYYDSSTESENFVSTYEPVEEDGKAEEEGNSTSGSESRSKMKEGQTRLEREGEDEIVRFSLGRSDNKSSGSFADSKIIEGKNRLEPEGEDEIVRFSLGRSDNRSSGSFADSNEAMKLTKRIVQLISPFLPRERESSTPRYIKLHKKHFYPRQNGEEGEEDDDDDDDDDDKNYGKEDKDDSKEDEGETSEYIFGLPFVVAIVLFVFHLVFLLFTIFVLWSYKKQLQYIARHFKNSYQALYR